MYKIAKDSPENLKPLFNNTAIKKSISPAIIEKDFWVCLILDYLFNDCTYKDFFTFKGGTSLSKCFNLINRFSEDIDLILDWQVLGYSLNEPWEDRSKNKQNRFNEEANQKAATFIANELLPCLAKDLEKIIGSKPNLYIDPIDPQTICFAYPHIFEVPGVLQQIRLEIGPLAAWTPSTKKSIMPYVAEYYPRLFNKSESVIVTASAERTFWEKVTILHHEANRPIDSEMPARYSRHYYDLYCIANSDYKISAFENIALLKKVISFKMKFYPRAWAKYEMAIPGSLKLIPPEERFTTLKNDYEGMTEMLFGEYPNFDDLMKFIHTLESEINNLPE